LIKSEDFIKPILARGYDFWTGVPCSILKPFINYVIGAKELDYVGASSEGEAVGIAMGAHLSGRKTVVICQNSGLGNMINPLASLNYTFRIPTLLIVTHRGAPESKDEPQHELMGQITRELLETMRIPSRDFPEETKDIERALEEADEYMNSERLPYALIMKKGIISPHPLKEKKSAASTLASEPQGTFSVSSKKRMARLHAIKTILGSLVGDELIIATTGKTGRELFDLGHRPRQLYVVGGMGCASSIGLGLSISRPERKVIVLDGDGATLMKMGTLATIGWCAPKNLLHVILDNEAHESTGGQATASETADIGRIAAACSYKAVFRTDTDEGLRESIKAALGSDGPVMIHIKVSVGSEAGLGRPTLTPVQVKEEFMRLLANG
jgi:phosphonopyruvate decarboxylase